MILLPYDLMSYNYPILKKAPVLLPFFWLARIFNIVFIKKDKKNKIKKVNHDFTITTSENINKYKEELNKVGLDFNF